MNIIRTDMIVTNEEYKNMTHYLLIVKGVPLEEECKPLEIKNIQNSKFNIVIIQENNTLCFTIQYLDKIIYEKIFS